MLETKVTHKIYLSLFCRMFKSSVEDEALTWTVLYQLKTQQTNSPLTKESQQTCALAYPLAERCVAKDYLSFWSKVLEIRQDNDLNIQHCSLLFGN